ncbi:MAG: cyclophilin-like fold protein [Pseudomonadales bacterium]
MAKIQISWPGGSVTATLWDTATASKLVAALPVESQASTWGDEVYFRLPFSAQREANATSVVNKGAVCFWLEGDSLALLFGPTPVSQGDECRLISDANILGEIDGDPETLRSVKSGDPIQIHLQKA